MSKPKLHVTASKHWMNDPNGLIYYQGNYHLFYQHFPYENKWGTMHWGHVVSTDLVDWKDLGIALYPSKPFDQNGCFSGSAIEIDDKMYLYYTAVTYDEFAGEDIHRQKDNQSFTARQAMLISDDGFTFDNYTTKKMIISCDDVGHRTHTRDPKVWVKNDVYYMVLVSKIELDKENRSKGQLLFYKSSDALNWEFVNRYVNQDLAGNMWECPDLFKINQTYLLTMALENVFTNPGKDDGIFSNLKIEENEEHYPSLAVYSLVNFEYQNCDLEMLGKPLLIDYGLDYYAPQSTIDEEGRRIMIGWLRMPEAESDGQWIGMLTFPRVVEIVDSKVYFRCHPNIDRLFIKDVYGHRIEKEQVYKISANLHDGDFINVGGYDLQYQNDQVVVNRAKVFNHPFGKKFYSPKLNGDCLVDMYIDTHVIELYINDGQYVVSTIVYQLGSKVEANVELVIKTIDTSSDDN